jgi:hypothetical protein
MPSIAFYGKFLGGSLVLAIVIFAMLQAQGKEPLTRLKTAPAGGKSPLDRIGSALTSVSALAVYMMITASVVFELVQPTIYKKWLGGPNGWAYFFAGIISLIVGSKLVLSGKSPLKWAGSLLILIGFILPLLLATSIGQNMAEKWDRATEGNYVTLSTTEWTEMYKLGPGEKLSYNRVDQSACILVRHGGDDRLIKIIGGCEPPEEYKAAKGTEIPKDAIAKGLEFRAVGKPTKLEITRS